MSFKNLSVREARSKQGEGYTYVDVRSIPEFELGHPAGAVNVPLLHRDEHTGQMMANRQFLDVMRANFASDAKLLIGCQVGGTVGAGRADAHARRFQRRANVLGGYDGARDPMTGSHARRGVAPGGPAGGGRPARGAGYEDLHARLAEQGPVAE